MEHSPGHRQQPDHQVRERHLDQILRVEIDGEPVAESDDVIKVEEDDNPPRYYFPRDDIQMSKLRRTETTSQCPFKGLAHYYNIEVAGESLQDAAWTYEDPYLEHATLKDRIAFYSDKNPQIVIAADA